jgi:guanylate kinase
MSQETSHMNGRLLIFSAPSGSGKTTIVRHLLDVRDDLEFSVSATSRPPRGQEQDGKDYYFLSEEDFRAKVNKNDFLEWEEVYRGAFYGTLRDEVERIWKKGNHVIFDMDVVGGLNLKGQFGERALAIFVMPPDLNELERRLRKRGTDSEDKISQRLEKAQQELSRADEFDHILINRDLEEAKKEAQQIVNNFLN